MGNNGYASIQLIDNGGASIVVPNNEVQFVSGTCSSGTVGQIVATRSVATLNSILGWGPLVEAAALTCRAGGTVLACRATSTTPGAATAVTHAGTGTSVMTITGAPFDSYLVKVIPIIAGTTGTGPCAIQISLDAGRSFSPTINLGTAVTYAIAGTGITLNFTVGTLVVGDSYVFSTTEPLWNDAGIAVAMAALQASPYAQQGFGSVHIPGPSAGSDATAFGNALEAWATAIAPLFSAAILSARDAHIPIAWGGAGETEAVWMSSLLTDYSAVAQKRVAVGAAYWNMASALINPLGMVPIFRRSVSYALAARTTAIQPQRSWGRVKDGALSQIIVNPTVDPTDGFVYHDESINPGLNAGRFASTTRRSYRQGVYLLQANNMAATGAQINSWPLIQVADVAQTILQQEGTSEVNDDVRLLKNGTMDPRDVATIQNSLKAALDQNMTNKQMVSSTAVVIDQTSNVQNTGIVPYVATITPRGTILQINGTLQYSNPNQA